MDVLAPPRFSKTAGDTRYAETSTDNTWTGDNDFTQDLTQNGVGLVKKGRAFFDPRDYGAIGDGNSANAAADTAGIQAAINAARDSSSAFGKATVRIIGNYFINAQISWNTYVTVEGNAQITSLISNASSYMIRTVSTDPGDIPSPIRQRAVSMSGVVLIGDGVTGGINVAGASGSDKPAHVSWRNCVVRDCGTGVNFGQNAYMNSFESCNIQGNDVGIKHSGASNSGERLVFLNCDITGNDKAFDLASSQAFHFEHCSFSYNTRQLGTTTQGQLYFENCHLEFDKPYATYLDITSTGATANFTDCRILIGTPSARSITIGADGTITGAGSFLQVGDQIAITGSTAPGLANGTYYVLSKPTTTSITVSLTNGGAQVVPSGSGTGSSTTTGEFPVINITSNKSKAVLKGGHIHGSASLSYFSTGAGSCVARGTQTSDLSALTPSLSDTTQELMDPGFEATTVQDDWVVTTGTDTIATSTSAARSGSRCLEITHPTKTTTGRVDLFVPIEPGDRVLSKFWYRLVGTTSAFAIDWYFANGKKTLGSSLASTTRSYADTDWHQLSQAGPSYRPAPSWARYFVIRFTVTSIDSGSTLQLDDFEMSRF